MTEKTEDLEFQERMIAMMAKQKELVDTHGVALVQIMGGDDGSLPFCYSMGAAQFDLPDVILVGAVPPQIIMHILNDIFANWKEKGLTLGVQSELIKDFNIELAALEQDEVLTEKFALQTPVFYEVNPEYMKRSDGVPEFVQVILPDENGKLPNEEGHNAEAMPQILLKPRVMH